MEASERSTDGQTSETRLGDGRVDYPLLTEAVEEALGDLVTRKSISTRFSLSPIRIDGTYAASDCSCLSLIAELNCPKWAWWVTYAPLYCATSSPSTKTLSFRSISSAMASLSASRTVISFCPDAYPLLAIDGVRAAARKAGRKAGACRVEAMRREAGRRSLEAAIVCDVRVLGGVVRKCRRRVLAAEASGGCWGCWTISSEVGDANRWGPERAKSHKASGGSPTLKCENTRHLTSSAPAALNAGD